jgi:hypothetical protein
LNVPLRPIEHRCSEDAQAVQRRNKELQSLLDISTKNVVSLENGRNFDWLTCTASIDK